jgi:hypothetical protein
MPSFAGDYEVELVVPWRDLGVEQPPGFYWAEWLSALFRQLFARESRRDNGERIGKSQVWRLSGCAIVATDHVAMVETVDPAWRQFFCPDKEFCNCPDN